MSTANLFTPYQLGPYSLANRLVMAPLTRNRAGPGLAPTALNARYYAQRASAGLIIAEATHFCLEGIGYPNTPGCHTPEQVAGWQQVTSAVHQAGGRIFLQLWHCGRVSHPALQPAGKLPVAPSPIPPQGDCFTYQGLQPFVTPRALTLEEIPLIVKQFQQGASCALDAGFDGIEIHAAHGYLIDQFLRDSTNHRQDSYGGSLENRTRFLIDMVEAAIAVWRADRVGVRISPLKDFNSMSDQDPQTTFTYVAQRLAPYQLAYLHVAEPLGNTADLTQHCDTEILRQAFGGTLMVNGGYDRARGDEAIGEGLADLVSFGVPFLANPDLPARLRCGAPLNPPDSGTFYGGDERGYVDYPALTD